MSKMTNALGASRFRMLSASTHAMQQYSRSQNQSAPRSKKFSSRAPQSPAPRKGHPGSTKPQDSELNDMILYAATHDTTSVLT